MKSILLTFIFAAFGLTRVFSQTVNEIPIKDIDVEYIQIIGTPKIFGAGVTIEIDFGQENNSGNKDTYPKDENGEYLTFNSMMDALNFMGKYGYEFVFAYTTTVSDTSISHYILKKRKG
jgi:hypothetical protein